MLSLVPSLLLSFASGPGYDGAKSGVCFTGCAPYARPAAPLHGPRAQTPPVSVPVTRPKAHKPIVRHLAQPIGQTPCPSLSARTDTAREPAGDKVHKPIMRQPAIGPGTPSHRSRPGPAWSRRWLASANSSCTSATRRVAAAPATTP
eukprot:scaffold5975_cov112-Isochrysis_galbana.AAC.2